MREKFLLGLFLLMIVSCLTMFWLSVVGLVLQWQVDVAFGFVASAMLGLLGAFILHVRKLMEVI